jgi:hypothetical protein
VVRRVVGARGVGDAWDAGMGVDVLLHCSRA